jgi:ATP adenylyltransferase/5',5'''-P-1,P-4-tetraphosphate phosphorylase II
MDRKAPIENIFPVHAPEQTPFTIEPFKIVHSIMTFRNMTLTAAFLQDMFEKLLNHISQQMNMYSSVFYRNAGEEHPMSYNWIFTRNWMMIVLRKHATSPQYGLNVNSLGMAGLLLAKNEQDLNYWKTVGPLNVLNSLGYPNPKAKGCQ